MDPKPVEYYAWLCEAPRQQEALTAADVDCVNDWTPFASVSSVDDLCRILNPDPSDDVCRQAEAELLAAILNLCKGRLSLDQPISSACANNLTVGQALSDAIRRLANPARTDKDCEMAKCEAEELNSLRPFGEAYILANRTGSIVRVSWSQPPSAGRITTSSFTIWRRQRGVGPFVPVGTVPELKFDDNQAIPGADFEYQVTVNR